MTCVTEISSAWLAELSKDCPLLHWPPPLTSPSPYYDPVSDEVLCYVIPKYGVFKWDLPPVKRPLRLSCAGVEAGGGGGAGEAEDGKPGKPGRSDLPLGYRKKDEAYRWFARLLLEGKVLVRGALDGDIQQVLSDSGTKFKDPPGPMITQMKPTPKVANLLDSLVKNKICSRASLLSALTVDKNVLKDEIQQFLSVEHRKEFRLTWLRFAKKNGC